MAEFYYGGQALIEGVMMRGRTGVAAVVRTPDDAIVSRAEPVPGNGSTGIGRLPFIRGLVMLWDMMAVGTRMMLFSANVQAKATTDREIPTGLIAVMMTFAAIFAVAVFFVAPLLLTRAGGNALSGGPAGNVVEGVVRLAFFLGYLLLLGRLGQMRRVFEYHGAEHKTINAYEHRAELTPASVARFSTIHVRCGTAFLLWVVVLSIFVFALIGHPSLAVSVVARIVLVPVIAAVSYEILRLGARFYHVAAVRAVIQPGLWLQRLTTREPDERQLEVAILALEQVLVADGVPAPAIAGSAQTAPVII